MPTRRDDFAGLRLRSAHGVVIVADLEAVGVGPSIRQRLVRECALTLVRPGVYVLGRPTGAWEQNCAIALAAAGPDAVLARWSAARLWKLDGFTVRPADPPSLLPISVNVGRDAGRRGADVHRVPPLEHAAVEDGLRITGINQTLIEVGASLSPTTSPGGHVLTPADQVELALETALHKKRTTIERVTRLVQACAPQREGASVLRAVLARRPVGAAATESWLETRTVQVLRNAGIVNVERQVWMFDRHGAFIGRIDLKIGWVIIECDGREFHGDFEVDRARWAALHAIGYLVLPVTFRLVELRTTEFLRSLQDLSAKAAESAVLPG